MAKALKDLYTPSFFSNFIKHWEQQQENLDKDSFLQTVYTEDWPKMELKQRFFHLAEALHKQLPKNYKEATEILIAIARSVSHNSTERIEYYFITTYIELYGLSYFEDSMLAMEELTQYYSCEFAIRPFLEQYPQPTIKQMLEWTQHPHHKVRRLASEGCRPMLPWAKRIELPLEEVLPILENLKSDDSLFVRKSVANHLNDISKLNPLFFKQLLKEWSNQNTHTTNWVLKHASRTLLKAADSEVMSAFGFYDISDLSIDNFKLSQSRIVIGSELEFSFEVKNQIKKEQLLRIEYAIYHLKANGSYNPKVFKISERTLKEKEILSISKRHSFKVISSRKYYDGEHFIQLILNGNKLNKLNFTLES